MNTNTLIKKLTELLKNPPEKGALFEYHRRLKGYKLSSSQLEELCDYLVDLHTFFPSIAEVSQAVLDLRHRHAVESRETHWITYKLGLHSFAERCHDPRDPPNAPKGAYDLHLVIGDPVGYTAAAPYEVRSLFKQGWERSGAPMTKLQEFLRILDTKKELRQF